MLEAVRKSYTLEDGREISIETGKLARQAHGAVLLRQGDTVLLATVVSAYEAGEGVDFLPLSVDYQEKYAAVGRYPGGFLKRESKLSEYEVLTSRLVDRALRPMFPKDYHADTQVIIYLISGDVETLPDAMAGFAASSALAVSDIPFTLISEVRVGRLEGKLIVNPTKAELELCDIDIMVAGSADSINMVEGEMHEISEEEMVEAIRFGHEEIKKQIALQNELKQAVGKPVREYDHEKHDPELEQKIDDLFRDKLHEIAHSPSSKQERSAAFDELISTYIDELPEDSEEDPFLIKQYYKKVQKEIVREMILTDRVRLDGRQLDEVRPIYCEADFLPSPHGSSLFTRGETQALATVTLGTKMDEQMIDGAIHKGYSKFLLHYNFPPFSTGESRFLRAPGRREIGHGNLALRALTYVLPPEEENPYTVRVVSDVLESNGSSSMATVCSGSMALMDAGVKLKGAVSGIAMGLITHEDGRYAVLSDILGDEDFLGDMDFKVAGTKDGITAVQMDIKIKGLSYDILIEALGQANQGRLHILDQMNTAIAAPREDFKPHVPRIERIEIPGDKIGAVIGPGGKVIQAIQRETEATINIDEKENGIGEVLIYAASADSMQAAVDMVKALVEDPEPGKIYKGKVTSIKEFGAFVEILPGREGLLHISEITWERLPAMDGVFEPGEEVDVKLLEVDTNSGKLRLSRKALMPKPDHIRERSDDDRGGRGGGGRRDDRRGGGNRGGGRRDDRRR